MNHDQKLAFLQNMTHMALTHAASTPNVPTPTGGMSHDKMLAFVSGIANKGIQHFDGGGTASNVLSSLRGRNVNDQNGITANLQPLPAAPVPNTQPSGVGGGISRALGTNNQYVAQSTPIQTGTNPGQLAAAYTGAQKAIGTQGQITNTLNAGLNQGVDNQSALSNMYLNQAEGNGPNPALAQLNQSTGNNIAQQAALAANQRGAGANAGLIARQNAQQGAATQQQAVGQGATMQAQQQLAAEQNLQNLSANEIAQGTTATQGLNSTQQNEQNILQGANTAANNAAVAEQSNLNNVNAGVAIANQTGSANALNGLFQAGATIAPIVASFAKGGRAQKMAEGGGIVGEPTSGPQSYVGQWLNSTTNNAQNPAVEATNLNTDVASPFKGLSMPSSNKAGPTLDNRPSQLNDADVTSLGAQAPALSNSAGASAMNIGAMAYKGGLMKNGGNIPGKAKVNRDSLQNDVVPAMLSPGEVVIDKDTLKDKGPVGQMARAVAAHIAHRNKGKK